MLLCQMHDISCMIRGNVLAQKKAQLIALYNYDFQTKVVDKRDGCLQNGWDLELLNGLTLAYYQPSPEVRT